MSTATCGGHVEVLLRDGAGLRREVVPEPGAEFLHIQEVAVFLGVLLLQLSNRDALVGGVDPGVGLVHLRLRDAHVRGGGVHVALEAARLHVVGDLGPLVGEILQHLVARLVVRVVVAVARDRQLDLVVVIDGGRTRPGFELVVLGKLVAHVGKLA